MTSDTAIDTIKRISNGSPFNLDAALVENWREIYRHATEVGLIAQRQLEAAGALQPHQRRILTREELRSKS